MVVRRSWILVASSLIALIALGVIGYWLWRPIPQIYNYIPTNNHVIIGFGSDFLQDNLTDIGQLAFQSWRSNVAHYIQEQLDAPLDQIQALVWSSDERLQQQTIVLQLKHNLSREQQQVVRASLIGKPTPMAATSWKEVVFFGSVVIITTNDVYQKPHERNVLLQTIDSGAETFVVWDKPLPIDLLPSSVATALALVGQQTEGRLLFDHHDTLYRLALRLPRSDNQSVVPVALPFTNNFQLYVAGQKREIEQLAKSQQLAPWYRNLDYTIGQKYGFGLTSALESFGDSFVFLLDQDNWLVQSSQSSLQQVASNMSGYFRPQIKKGRLPDGSLYQELVRSEGTVSTSTLSGQEILVWQTGTEDSIYQYNQAERSTLSTGESLLATSIAPQPQNGLWQACVPTTGLTWTNIIWLQHSADSAEGQLLPLSSPWKAVGLLSGQSDQSQEYIFCIL